MSYSISTLLTRNLHHVFGENDPARRRAAIDEIFTEDCVFYDPKGGVYRARIRSEARDENQSPIHLPTQSCSLGNPPSSLESIQHICHPYPYM
jgi:hypothetical protein